MSKIYSPSSNNSSTSSETSETQSVEEASSGSNVRRTSNPSTKSAAEERIPKTPKRMKDANNDKDNEKRPPWRAVSVSTLPKPDKNALLKAKLLDASRRMRAGKASISIQTDIEPTKLMKEVSLGPQTDLILLREAGVMTDGAYMKRRAGTDEFILTYAVSTLTDAIQYANASTQTLLPKLPEDKQITPSLQSAVDSAMNLEDFKSIQQKLLNQISKLRNTSLPTIFEDPRSRRKRDESREEEEQTMLLNYKRPSFLAAETLHSWHFELDEAGEDSHILQPYTIIPNRPWKSFMPLSSCDGVYGNYVGPQRLDWNIILLAIDELIQESNYLVDIIEDTSRIEVVEPPRLEKPTFSPLPSEHWLPIIERQEKELEAMQQKMNGARSGEHKSY